MWRFHLTTDDLLRIRIAAGVDPMWETVQSLRIVNARVGEEVYGRWRRYCRQSLPGLVRRLADLPVTDGGPGGDRRTGDALLRSYFELALLPRWPQIRRQVGEELADRRAVLAGAGVDTLLRTLSASLLWDSSVLALTRPRTERDIRLGGRGLLLQPSFFAYDAVTAWQQHGGQVVLCYPIRPAVDWFTSPMYPPDGPLAAVLGRTRSRVLETLGERACTTTELAELFGISLAAASKQATRLRLAGLVRSTPQGKCVVHQASAVGLDLLGVAGRT